MQIHTESTKFRGIPGKIYYKNTAEFREIPRNSVCFSTNSVFRRKWKKHFRGHPTRSTSCLNRWEKVYSARYDKKPLCLGSRACNQRDAVPVVNWEISWGRMIFFCVIYGRISPLLFLYCQVPSQPPFPLIFPLYRKLRRKKFCFVITEYFKIWNSLGSFSLYSINLFVLPGSKHAWVLQEASGRKEKTRE